MTHFERFGAGFMLVFTSLFLIATLWLDVAWYVTLLGTLLAGWFGWAAGTATAILRDSTPRQNQGNTHPEEIEISSANI